MKGIRWWRLRDNRKICSKTRSNEIWDDETRCYCISPKARYIYTERQGSTTSESKGNMRSKGHIALRYLLTTWTSVALIMD